jgi:hypothetical protein
MPLTLKVALADTDRFRHATLLFTLTEYAPSIYTLSPAPGTLAPEAPPEVADQVAVWFQSFEATAYLSAADAFTRDKTNAIESISSLQI